MNTFPMIGPMLPDNEPNENSSLNMIPTIAPMILDIEPYKNSTKDTIPMIVPILPDKEPNANSSLDDLAAYALVKQKSIIANDKKNAEDMWLMGQALEWAFEKTPHGQWEQWFKAKKLTKTLVWQARTLHERATLDQVKNFGLTKALRKFKVVAEKEAKPEAATVLTKEVDEKVKSPLTTHDEGTEPTNEVEGGNLAKTNEEGIEQPADVLAEEEEKEIKAFQETLRQPTPKTSAVAILHALELLRDDLNEEEVDQELQETFGKIVDLAEELKGLNKHNDANKAA